MKKLFTIACLFVALCCAAQISDIFESTTVTKLADANFGEGPRWHPDGYLLFTEFYANKISKYQNGAVSTFLDNANATVTLAITATKQIYLGQGLLPALGPNGGRRISVIQPSGAVQSLTTTFGGKKYNTLWDIWLRSSDNLLYFVDNTYLVAKFNLTSWKEMENGVYSYNPPQML